MMLDNVTTVAAITVLCMLAGEAWKVSKLDNKWIPILVGVVGGALGALGYFVIPDYPAADIITAIAVGIVSGGGSTWLNQAYRQLREESK